jgi:molybdopterin molybdotransferase
MQSETIDAARAEQVWEILRRHVTPLPRVDATLRGAVGRVLAGDVRCGADYPPYDRAAMDGYAVRCADFAGDGATLTCGGLQRAGGPPSAAVEPGGCVQINTGAAVPAGADAVVVVEKSTPRTDGRVTLADRPRAGQHIERRGGLRRRGDLVLRAPCRIRGGTLAAIVSAGAQIVRIFRPPNVAIVGTGDEVGKDIPDSNTLLLRQLAESFGCEARPLGIAPDEPVALRDMLSQGLESDLLCVTGGMSKGTHDLVPSVLESLGVTWMVRSLDLKPGKPTRIGRSRGGGWVLGLPGNPVSCAVCFHLFGRTILNGLQGLASAAPPRLAGELHAALPACGGRPMFHPATWTAGPDGRSLISPIDWRGSGDPFGLASANALLYRAAHAAAADRGERVEFIPIESPE